MYSSPSSILGDLPANGCCKVGLPGFSEVEKVLLLGSAKKDSKTLRVVFSLKPKVPWLVNHLQKEPPPIVGFFQNDEFFPPCQCFGPPIPQSMYLQIINICIRNI